MGGENLHLARSPEANLALRALKKLFLTQNLTRAAVHTPVLQGLLDDTIPPCWVTQGDHFTCQGGRRGPVGSNLLYDLGQPFQPSQVKQEKGSRGIRQAPRWGCTVWAMGSVYLWLALAEGRCWPGPGSLLPQRLHHRHKANGVALAQMCPSLLPGGGLPEKHFLGSSDLLPHLLSPAASLLCSQGLLIFSTSPEKDQSLVDATCHT